MSRHQPAHDLCLLLLDLLQAYFADWQQARNHLDIFGFSLVASSTSSLLTPPNYNVIVDSPQNRLATSLDALNASLGNKTLIIVACNSVNDLSGMIYNLG